MNIAGYEHEVVPLADYLKVKADADRLAEALKWYATIHRCENPIKKPLPNPEGYASNVECLPCGVCHHCIARTALAVHEEAKNGR